MSTKPCDIGLVGLGVMGRNFVLNLADKGFGICVYNRTEEKTREFTAGKKEDQRIEPAVSLSELSDRLKFPRAVLMFVPAGPPVDEVIDGLIPVLTSGDLIVDCGNSHFQETNRRQEMLNKKGIRFMGMGVSGGESGARTGPSMMPGGSEAAYQEVRTILEAAAAKVNGEPCVAYLGPGSAGHYVKMVHNGIEYGIMELIAETYDLFARGLNFDVNRLAGIFERFNAGRLNSYLMEITARIFDRKDDKTGKPMMDIILDRARQKGTGKWTSTDALALRTPVPTIDSAVAMRNLSDHLEERRRASKTLTGPFHFFQGDETFFIQKVEKALLAAVIITFAQGMRLLSRASREYNYGLDLGAVAKIWRGGCIIRSALLEDIREAFHTQSDLTHLLCDPVMARMVKDSQESLRKVIITGIELGIPVPGLMSALANYDAFRSDRLPANLIMAQRDFFGAHRYERIDEKGTFHTEWTQ